MRKTEFDKNVRFSYFLPYGFISPMALELSVDIPGAAYTDYEPNGNIENRIDICEKAHRRRIDALYYMEQYGYIESVMLRTREAVIRAYRLTKPGFYLLTNTPDPETELQRWHHSKQPKKRNRKEQAYLPSDKQSETIRQLLYDKATKKHTSKENRALFDDLFFESFMTAHLTPLATEPYLAKRVSMYTNLKSNQIYTAWRLTNIEALFRALGCLTSIDRNHIDLRRKEKTSFDPFDDNSKIDIQAFTQWTLEQWYTYHPDALTFNNPKPGSVSRNTWEATQSFYALTDLPGFESVITNEANMNLRGSNSIMRHSSLGLAVGSTTNYLVYHTKPKGFSWAINIERFVAKAAQQALDLAAKNRSVLGAKREVRNAIIVCPTVHQFAALFKVEMPSTQQLKKYDRVDAPFNSASIVPINHSGIMQLRLLLLANPITYEAAAVRNFLTLPGFVQRPKGIDETDNIFPLLYNGKPVLLAQLMEYQKLYWALQKYNQGKRFYVICYPEQVKFIKKIMPEVEFL